MHCKLIFIISKFHIYFVNNDIFFVHFPYFWLFLIFSFWLYINRLHHRGPNRISYIKLPSELENMDAAFHWQRDGNLYFFKRDKYWKSNGLRGIDPDFPKDINTTWRGVPESGIEAVFQWKNDKIYFFKGEDCYAFDEHNMRVQEGYPCKVATHWMGCVSNGKC